MWTVADTEDLYKDSEGHTRYRVVYECETCSEAEAFVDQCTDKMKVHRGAYEISTILSRPCALWQKCHRAPFYGRVNMITAVNVTIKPRQINSLLYTDVFFEVTEDGKTEHYYGRNPYVINDTPQERNAQAQQWIARQRRFP